MCWNLCSSHRYDPPDKIYSRYVKYQVRYFPMIWTMDLDEIATRNFMISVFELSMIPYRIDVLFFEIDLLIPFLTGIVYFLYLYQYYNYYDYVSCHVFDFANRTCNRFDSCGINPSFVPSDFDNDQYSWYVALCSDFYYSFFHAHPT